MRRLLGWSSEWRRRLPELIIAAGAILSALGLLELGREGQDPLVSRWLAGWILVAGVVLLMTGITALQYAQLDCQGSGPADRDVVPTDRATPPVDRSSSPEDQVPAWQLWRHW
jgi:heme A synthase